VAFQLRRADYFYTTVESDPASAWKLLSRLAAQKVNLLAFAAVPMGPARTQLTLFPEDDRRLEEAAKEAGLDLDGPHPALLAQGDDELGALAHIHEKLAEAHVHVYASTGVTDGRGSYGYVIYVRPEEFEPAALALDLWEQKANR
jgi:hypothetical protein